MKQKDALTLYLLGGLLMGLGIGGIVWNWSNVTDIIIGIILIVIGSIMIRVFRLHIIK
jgi:hypothetical protein